MGTFRTLKDEILSGESPTLEFKCDIPEQAIKYLKTVCAFANCLGGRIVFGVDTDLSIVGMSDPFVARDRIADAIANGIEPMIVPDISFQTVDGKTLVVVEIAQSPRCPHWVKRLGRENGTFVRYDATTRAADADVLRELVYDGSDRGFDAAQCRLLELTSRKIAARHDGCPHAGRLLAMPQQGHRGSLCLYARCGDVGPWCSECHAGVRTLWARSTRIYRLGKCRACHVAPPPSRSDNKR